jgi:4,5-dihydroxyphthalate decarboxylase
MSDLPITVLAQPHDSLQPLAAGAVKANGIDLTLVQGSLRAAMTDESILVSEISFARHVRRTSDGDRSWVGVPAFVRRGFAHRFWYVPRDSGLTRFSDVAGKRVGTNEWPATGNSWARAAAREQGVDLTSIAWTVGSVDGGEVSTTDTLPSHVRFAEPGRALREMLLAGELDALECPDPPAGFYDPDSPIVRLFEDFRTEEIEYYKRTHVFPGLHVIGIRRALFDREPWVARSLFDALLESRRRWEQLRLEEGDTSPWLMADIEETMSLMGTDWQPYGVDGNLTMISAFCEELLAQGLIERSVHARELFAEFTALD